MLEQKVVCFGQCLGSPVPDDDVWALVLGNPENAGQVLLLEHTATGLLSNGGSQSCGL